MFSRNIIYFRFFKKNLKLISTIFLIFIFRHFQSQTLPGSQHPQVHLQRPVLCHHLPEVIQQPTGSQLEREQFLLEVTKVKFQCQHYTTALTVVPPLTMLEDPQIIIKGSKQSRSCCITWPPCWLV